jgi:hypothetical protein
LLRSQFHLPSDVASVRRPFGSLRVRWPAENQSAPAPALKCRGLIGRFCEACQLGGTAGAEGKQVGVGWPAGAWAAAVARARLPRSWTGPVLFGAAGVAGAEPSQFFVLTPWGAWLAMYRAMIVISCSSV